MLPKIRYRLVWNFANKLNAQGMAMVAVECWQERRKMYNEQVKQVVDMLDEAGQCNP